MKTKCFLFYIGALLLFLCLITGCYDDFTFNANGQEEISQSDRYSDISIKIGNLKNAGLLDSLISTNNSSRSVTEIDPNEEQIRYFIEHTDEALAEIALLEDGDIQIQLISVLLSDSTVGEVADVMALLSEEMADEYLLKMEEIYNSIELTNDNIGTGRSILPKNNIRNIRLMFYDNIRNNIASRGAYAADFNTVAIITVATAAALYLTPTGRAAWTAVKNAWNAIIAKVTSVLPKGILFIINGVKLAPI